jgi:hypothetical protein
MPDIARTFVKNLGARRFLDYLPPNGRELITNQTIEIPGIFESLLYSGRDSAAMERYRQDLIAGRILVTYSLGNLLELTEPTSDLGSVPTQADQFLVPLATANLDFQPTGLQISQTPTADSGVSIFVNGVRATLSNGNRAKEFYFSADSGATGKLLSDVATGDSLYFNALIAGYQLSATDLVALDYDVLVGASSSS